jgi:lysyl-tRNA synthetase, class II
MLIDPIIYKANLIWGMRVMLAQRGFLEFMTPAIRKHPGDKDRPRVELLDGRWLRESAAFALRLNLSRHKKIYEIGPMFRPDQTDSTHLGEFAMLDLYWANSTLEQNIELAKALITKFYTGVVEHLSFAEVANKEFGIDLVCDPEGPLELEAAIRNRYRISETRSLKILDAFIKSEIEPRSIGKCLIVSEFPLATEIRAKARVGTKGISDRFEFQIDGIEIVHGYTDVTDSNIFESQAKLMDSYGPEDKIMAEILKKNEIPESSGFGIGIERFCQVCTGTTDIRDFGSSPEFVD